MNLKISNYGNEHPQQDNVGYQRVRQIAAVYNGSDRSRRFAKACRYGMYQQLITKRQIQITCWMQQIDKELHTHTYTSYGTTENPEHVNPSLNLKKRIEKRYTSLPEKGGWV